MYESNFAQVRINNSYTDVFGVSSGVRQGCVLSPTLFSVYINDLVHEINSLNCGVYIDDKMLSLLLYADDIALLAPDESCLQRMLDCVSDWCSRWRLSVNGSKTKVVHYRPPSFKQSEFIFINNNNIIGYNHAYKYLGVWLQEHLDLNFTAREIAKSASRALGVLICKFKSLGGLAHSVFNTLYDNLVQPILSYGSAIWGTRQFSCINAVQNRACRFYLGVCNKTPNLAI